MSDWTDGYVADIGYTYGYYPELNPLRVKLALLSQGIAAPEIATACELGFGQGVSIVMHAASTTTEWYGTDFNPAQAGFARDLAVHAGCEVNLHDQGFAEFAMRTDLPQFDYIGLHGIWSWINDENRQIIVDFIRNRLRVGGVVYISYNAQPGWAAFTPIRHLMNLHAETMGSKGQGVIRRVDGALKFVDELFAVQPAYEKANGQVKDRLEKIKTQAREYLTHEYFNRDWVPMHFSEMTRWLESAKVQFACSANNLELVNALHFDPDQQRFLDDISDIELRETARDFIVNQQFRRDYWVKGARKINVVDKATALRKIKVVLVAPRADIPLQVKGARGEAELNEEVYVPILEILQDHKPHTLEQIESAVESRGINLAQIIQAMLVLTGNGHLSIAQDDVSINKLKKITEKLNVFLINKSRGDADVNYLASPVTGGGIPVGRIQQLFLISYIQGKKDALDWAEYAWSIIRAQGQKLIKSGVTMQSDEDNIAELKEQAKNFERRIVVLKALQVI